MNVCVADVMTRYAVAVGRGASFQDMAAQLSRFRVSAFPVVDDDGTVIGVVSETDMLTRHVLDLAGEELAGEHAGEEPQEPDDLTAGDLMTQPAVTITPDESLENAARLMYNSRVRRLPVVDADGRLAGIISRADVLAVFDRTNEEIGEDIGQVISREFRYDPCQFTVTVRSGVVTLQGSPETAALGRDIVHKVRHVPGVVAVRDRLSYPLDQAAFLPCDPDLRSRSCGFRRCRRLGRRRSGRVTARQDDRQRPYSLGRAKDPFGQPGLPAPGDTSAANQARRSTSIAAAMAHTAGLSAHSTPGPRRHAVAGQAGSAPKPADAQIACSSEPPSAGCEKAATSMPTPQGTLVRRARPVTGQATEVR